MNPYSLTLRSLTVADHPAVARLLHHSLVSWYESRLGQGARFGDSSAPFLLFPEVYAVLDPGHSVTAWDQSTGKLIGVCFMHPRETHVAVGIVATAPEAQGRGVARAMLQPVIDAAIARERGIGHRQAPEPPSRAHARGDRLARPGARS